MFEIFAMEADRVVKQGQLSKSCWINIVNPDEEEIDEICASTGVLREYLTAALDEEEMSRIESDEGQTLVLVDLPVASQDDKNVVTYSTLPLGVIFTDQYMFTVSLRDNTVVREFCDGLIRGVNVGMRSRFLLQMLLRVAGRYLQYLRQIDKIAGYIERQLHSAMKNKELIQLLDLQKSLVYFSTSLKSNEMTLEKISRGRFLKMYEEDAELLEDVLIEFRQARETTDIYSSILTGTVDAFASVISNNLNVVMKVLASITILLSIPSIVFGFYGMNIGAGDIPLDGFWWFPLVLSLGLIGVSLVWLIRKKMM